jgi:hypothetical protein
MQCYSRITDVADVLSAARGLATPLCGSEMHWLRRTQTHRHTDTQTHRHTDTQTHRHTDTQTHRHTDTQTHRHTDTQEDVNDARRLAG